MLGQHIFVSQTLSISLAMITPIKQYNRVCCNVKSFKVSFLEEIFDNSYIDLILAILSYETGILREAQLHECRHCIAHLKLHLPTTFIQEQRCNASFFPYLDDIWPDPFHIKCNTASIKHRK